MSGPPPKPAHLRQRTNRKPGAATIEAVENAEVPDIPNPDDRKWHALTIEAWQHAWESPMASQWLETDIDALGRVALLWDDFYKAPDVRLMSEIRLQEQRFGLSPLDRTRLQWEVTRTDEAERKRPKPAAQRAGADPRNGLMAVS